MRVTSRWLIPRARDQACIGGGVSHTLGLSSPLSAYVPRDSCTAPRRHGGMTRTAPSPNCSFQHGPCLRQPENRQTNRGGLQHFQNTVDAHCGSSRNGSIVNHRRADTANTFRNLHRQSVDLGSCRELPTRNPREGSAEELPDRTTRRQQGNAKMSINTDSRSSRARGAMAPTRSSVSSCARVTVRRSAATTGLPRRGKKRKAQHTSRQGRRANVDKPWPRRAHLSHEGYRA